MDVVILVGNWSGDVHVANNASYWSGGVHTAIKNAMHRKNPLTRFKGLGRSENAD